VKPQVNGDVQHMKDEEVSWLRHRFLRSGVAITLLEIHSLFYFAPFIETKCPKLQAVLSLGPSSEIIHS